MRAPLIFAAVLLTSLSAVRAEDQFVTERAKAHYEPARAINILHLKLEPQIDMPAGRITGAVTLTAAPLTNSLTGFTLHAVDMDIFSVRLNDSRELSFQTDDTALHITLDHPYTIADTFDVRVMFEAYPKMGLYFVRPSEDYPAKPWQVWSQGEMIENRHWFPSWDYPNDRFTSEMIITVPEGMIAISNGALMDSATTDGATTFHWRESVPHVNYLISLIVGEYVEVSDEWDGIPLSYFTLPEDSKYVELCFGKTPDMMTYFSEITGVRYPYEKYAQTVVDDFTWGGMENISATTLARRTIHDERAHQDYQSDALVAHELAHQWFGDLVSFRSWDHAWLSEGFADYFETLYLGHDRGAEDFEWLIKALQDAYFKEDNKYRRPVVTRIYEDPQQLFDSHSYRKGALVLHMLRDQLGDDLWRRAINHYLITRRETVVDTEDFRKAITEATGRPLDWFFDQWLYRAGYPEFVVDWRWDDSLRLVELNVRQTQTVDSLTPLFRTPIEILIRGDFGEQSLKLDITKADQTFYLPAPARPAQVLFDPENVILKKLTFKKDVAELIEQLSAGPTTSARLRAAEWLGERPDSHRAVNALSEALAADTFWGVRAACATALGKLKGDTAAQALISALDDQRSEVRVAAATALGEFPETAATITALERVFHTDLSYKAQSEALKALAKAGADQAFKHCREALRMTSYREQIRSAAFDALITLKDSRGLDLAIDWSEPGKPVDARTTAIKALGTLGAEIPERTDDVLKRLIDLLSDEHYRVRHTALKALGDLGDPAATAALEEALQREPLWGMKKAARAALKKLEDSTATELDDLRAQLETTQAQLDSLRQLVDTLNVDAD